MTGGRLGEGGEEGGAGQQEGRGGLEGLLLPLPGLSWADTALRCPDETRIGHIKKVGPWGVVGGRVLRGAKSSTRNAPDRAPGRVRQGLRPRRPAPSRPRDFLG